MTFNWYKCSICGARVTYTFGSIIEKKCFRNKLCDTCCKVKHEMKQVTLSDY